MPDRARFLASSPFNPLLEVSTLIQSQQTLSLPSINLHPLPPYSPATASLDLRHCQSSYSSNRTTRAPSATLHCFLALFQSRQVWSYSRHTHTHLRSGCDGNGRHCPHRDQAQFPSSSRYHSHLTQQSQQGPQHEFRGRSSG